jgi:hypothetical protein
MKPAPATETISARSTLFWLDAVFKNLLPLNQTWRRQEFFEALGALRAEIAGEQKAEIETTLRAMFDTLDLAQQFVAAQAPAKLNGAQQ